MRKEITSSEDLYNYELSILGPGETELKYQGDFHADGDLILRLKGLPPKLKKHKPKISKEHHALAPKPSKGKRILQANFTNTR